MIHSHNESKKSVHVHVLRKCNAFWISQTPHLPCIRTGLWMVAKTIDINPSHGRNLFCVLQLLRKICREWRVWVYIVQCTCAGWLSLISIRYHKSQEFCCTTALSKGVSTCTWIMSTHVCINVHVCMWAVCKTTVHEHVACTCWSWSALKMCNLYLGIHKLCWSPIPIIRASNSTIYMYICICCPHFPLVGLVGFKCSL